MRELIIFWGFLFGAAWGSFAAASLWRIRRGISLQGRSRCTWCGEEISFTENVPVVSWIMLGGKTACCGKRLSPLYNIIELLCGVGFCFLLAWSYALAGAVFVASTLLLVLAASVSATLARRAGERKLLRDKKSAD